MEWRKQGDMEEKQWLHVICQSSLQAKNNQRCGPSVPRRALSVMTLYTEEKKWKKRGVRKFHRVHKSKIVAKGRKKKGIGSGEVQEINREQKCQEE